MQLTTDELQIDWFIRIGPTFAIWTDIITFYVLHESNQIFVERDIYTELFFEYPLVNTDLFCVFELPSDIFIEHLKLSFV